MCVCVCVCVCVCECECECVISDDCSTVPPVQKYSSTDLKGLTVQHTTEAFQEGGQIVLTLKDAGELLCEVM